MTSNRSTVDPALEMIGATKFYGTTRGLKNCTFAVPAGTVCALVGRNGSGKTTALKVAAGLIELDEGSVKVNSSPMQFGGIAPVSYVAQTKSLYPSLKVLEIIRYASALALGEFDESLAVEWVAEHGIPLDQRLGTLSGGQRTQVALATALGRNVSVIVLDEPMADLDPIARDLVANRLIELSKSGRTILVSSHAVSELSGFCNYIVVLKRGDAILSSWVKDIVVSQPLDRVVLDLLRADSDSPGVAQINSEKEPS